MKGKKVALGMERTIGTGVTHGEWTDSEGEAHFEVKAGPGKVYVDGSKRHEGASFWESSRLYVVKGDLFISVVTEVGWGPQYEVSTRSDHQK